MPVPTGPARVAVTPDAVWVLSPPDNTVSRIDPATNRRVATVPVGRQASGMAVAGGAVWVSLPERGGLGRIDPAGNRLTLVPVRQCCFGELVGGERALWAANAWDGTLIRLDPSSGREVARIALPRAAAQYPCWVVAGGGAVWVTSATTEVGTARQLWRVDPETGRVSGSMSLGPAASRRIPDAPALDGTTLWVASGDSGAVLRLEPRP